MNEPLPIGPIQPASPVDSAKSLPNEGVKGESFADVLGNTIQEVNALQKDAEKQIEQLELGKAESVSEVFTAVEKADLAFRTLMQVRNKLLSAYEEINRLRV